MLICTIIAQNYAAFARVLARSVAEHHPGTRLVALVIDDVDGWLAEGDEPFEVATPESIGLEAFGAMAERYDVVELSTAVKPWLLAHLLEREGGEQAVYLDPDIRLYRPLDPVAAALAEHDLALIPHFTAPLPRDGRTPNEQDILIAGTFNLGFMALRRGEPAERALAWWQERLLRDCIVDPARGFFVDQRWIDLLPGFDLEIAVLRDPGLNVAYWNLPARRFEHNGTGYRVDGEPLTFFHFSGFRPHEPGDLSKYQNRIDLADVPALAQLCGEYAQEVLADGHDGARRRPYGHARLADGTVIDRWLRRAIGRAQLDGVLDAPIATAAGTRALLDWLNEPASGHAGAAGVTRYLAILHAERADIRREFPSLVADAPRLVEWAQAESTIAEALRPVEGAETATTPGVNVVGYFRSEVGVGEAGRLVVQALRAADVPVRTIRERAGIGVEREPFHGDRDGPPHDVTLACVNADMLPGLHARAPELFEDRHAVGLWFWEVERFPEQFHGAFELVDEVWAASRHIADALRPGAPVPVVQMPVPVVPPAAADGVGRVELGLPDGTLFMFAWDYRSVMARKNPLGTLAAFTAAFPEPGSATLVLKCINADAAPEHHRAVSEAVAERPDVLLVDRYLEAGERDALLHACDAYVSLHRAEGLGLVIAEAMSLGKPVIATGYSGNADLMTEANSYPVPYELVRIGPGADPYPADARWAEPDVEAAARALAEVHERPELAAERGRVAARDIRARRSPEVVGKRMAERLVELRGGAAPRRRPRPAEVPPIPEVGRARERFQRGPQPGGGSLGRARRAARPALLRAMQPYTAYQREVDAELLDALTVIEERVIGLTEAALRHDRAVERLTRAEGDLRRLIADADERGEEATQRLADQIDGLHAGVRDLETGVREALERIGMANATKAHPTQDVALDERGWPRAPREPWSHAYNAAHRAFVARAIADPDVLTRMRDGDALPPAFGVGFDERVVEFPWLLARDLSGAVLDAGSTLNHAHVLPRVLPRVDDLHIVTLAPEAEAHPHTGASYVFADLRDLPFRDETYDAAVSISTLDHVGMDNSHFGGPKARAEDPVAEAARAAAELRRVVKRGGVLFLTVPFGRAEDFGWVRVFDEPGLQDLVAPLDPVAVATTIFRYDRHGWHLATAADAADLRYSDHFSEPEPGADRAVAARAVACLELRI